MIMPHLPWKRFFTFPSKTFGDSSPAGTPPLTATKDAGGGVIGKQSPEIRIFLRALASRRKKSRSLILIYFQLRNVNFVSGPRNILSFSTGSRTGWIGVQNVTLLLREPFVLTGQVLRLNNYFKTAYGICTLVCKKMALRMQRVESFY
jgi:hypothetical protein